jgi:hypothetical protein
MIYDITGSQGQSPGIAAVVFFQIDAYQEVSPFSSLNFWECAFVCGEIIKRVAPGDVNFNGASCRASSSRLRNGHHRPL